MIILTVKEAIEKADITTPNAFPIEAKLDWLNEIEGKVQSEVLLLAPEEIITYTKECIDHELLVSEPHCSLYPAYLRAQMDFASSDWNRYQNTREMFNSLWRKFVCYFTTFYRPADTREEVYE